jgi:hypothetical protein
MTRNSVPISINANQTWISLLSRAIRASLRHSSAFFSSSFGVSIAALLLGCVIFSFDLLLLVVFNYPNWVEKVIPDLDCGDRTGVPRKGRDDGLPVPKGDSPSYPLAGSPDFNYPALVGIGSRPA